MPKRQDRGPLLATVVGCATDQLATRAIYRAMGAMQDTLEDMGFGEVASGEIEGFVGWDYLQDDLEELMRKVWRSAAEDVERTQRGEGIDPEAEAELKVPDGVVPS